ncbi:uncharacterized protein [Lepeophtheirus salmonis]|uniref:uncharacterized protein isoform X3 n=1 Tax=Lepeophtheirus salmonis TaxID=72036 RepID=UPI003AF3D547
MVLTYNFNDGRPNKDWVLKTEANIDGDCLSYLDMMEKNSAEDRRRQRERVIMEEGKALWQAKKHDDFELELREQEEIRELSRNKIFGKPGHGAPTMNNRKKLFTEHQLHELCSRPLQPHEVETNLDGNAPTTFTKYQGEHSPRVRSNELQQSGNGSQSDEHDALTFGRAGNGAPVRTKSGRIRTAIVGNPEIRFQENESVQKTIYNSIRYSSNREDKEHYSHILEDQIKTRRMQEMEEREKDIQQARAMEQTEGSQWGRPGPGGTYWRNSAVTGQNFFDKMGWSGSGDPRKRNVEVRAFEVEEMQKELEGIRLRKESEAYDIKSPDKVTGKPRKDPNTGYMMNHSLPSTDVTKTADPKRAEVLPSNRNFGEDRKSYFDSLNYQVNAREHANQIEKKNDEEQQKRHFESWETFWGRPGYGAPKDGRGPQKENLMKLLHYSTTEKSPNNVELITLERLPVK